MKNLPKISIVIPSYNKAQYIKETLKSIFSQNYPNLEVIIQDGGSTDGSVAIIKQFAKKYPKEISWVSKKDKGQVDAINKGLKKATGEIITYINADDVYERGALKKVGEYFKKKPNTLWLAGRGRIINEKEKEVAKWVTAYKNFLLKINHYSLLLIVNYLFQPSVFLSQEAYLKYGPFTGVGKIVMEYSMWLRLSKQKMPAILEDYLSSFRILRGTFSLKESKKILDFDNRLALKYTKNPIVLSLHKFNNLARTFLARLV